MPHWFLVILGAGTLLLTWRTIRVTPGPHRNALECGECEYSLEGLGEVVRCPECGKEDARYREEVATSRVEYGVRPRRALAFLLLAGFLVLGSWAHEAILREAYATAMRRWYDPAAIRPMFHYPDAGTGWANLAVLAGWVLTWVSGKRRDGLVFRAMLCGLVYVVVAACSAWFTVPLKSPSDVQSSTTAVATLGLALAYTMSGITAWAGQNSPTTPQDPGDPE